MKLSTLKVGESVHLKSSPPPQRNGVLQRSSLVRSTVGSVLVHRLSLHLGGSLLGLVDIVGSLPSRRCANVVAREDVSSNAVDGWDSSSSSLACKVAVDVLARASAGVDLSHEGAEGVELGAKVEALLLESNVAAGEIRGGCLE